MLFLLSPAKSLDFETPIKLQTSTQAQFLSQAQQLAATAAKLSSTQLQTLMDISPALAELNRARFQAWQIDHPIEQGARQAVMAFDGDVYDGLNAKGLTKPDLNYLQKHLRILSGLYGLLRPFDAIRPYRLEMGSQLKTAHAKNLYEFWGDGIAQAINEHTAEINSNLIINLASEEYFKSVRLSLLNAKVITPVFEDFSSGKYKIVSFFAKRARGSMVRYCAVNRVKSIKSLKEFDHEGYRFCEEVSGEARLVFRRKTA